MAQDKVMLELGDELTRLRREVKALRDRVPSSATSGESDDDGPERPPHY